MGQKVNPLGFRLGVIKDWNGRWYANKRSYAELLHEDLEIRKLIKQRFYLAGVSRIEIERAANRCKISIHTGRPGMIIGKGGA
ncbi:MAG: KH domain-containing protein, partial [Limnochordia bacterium]